MSDTMTLRVASFNVSMEAGNYVSVGEGGALVSLEHASWRVLADRLASGTEEQIRNIAEIIQRTRPDIILLNEFDYIESPQQGVKAFIEHYLHRSQHNQPAIDYPYWFYAPVNSGLASPFDLNRDGQATGTGPDAWGFGYYPGQFGMLLLSRYPIDQQGARTFQHFRWKDMPQHAEITTVDGEPWYAADAWQAFPLSSKSHWDVPVNLGNKRLHLLASHPTPPVFDGPEQRNAHRNHDEIRFWYDYIAGADYIYDDRGGYGGISKNAPFVLLGDLNACIHEGDARRQALQQLLKSPLVQGGLIPMSEGGVAHSQHLIAQNKLPVSLAAAHTASWRMRADYVLPSSYGIEVHASGVFWPTAGEPGSYLVKNRGASSDHRLVWVDIELT